MNRLAPIAALVLALLAALPPGAAGAAGCQFRLGFAALHDLIAPVVGDCLEDERHDPASGDALQRTTGGLLVWRKADNVTAFTDGYRTWLNGPRGLQVRLNGERLDWEGGAAAGGAAVGGAPGGPAAGGAPGGAGTRGAPGGAAAGGAPGGAAGAPTSSPTGRSSPGAVGAPSRPAHVAFVFLTGYASSLGAETASPFAALERELVTRGFAGDAFLDFSYAGGAVVDGRWRPTPFGCASTAAPLATDVARLGDLIGTYARARPGARFVLVGHSLGGLVGWQYLAALRSGGAPGLDRIAGLVTVDAPLRGVGADKTLAAALTGCGGPILDELAALYDDADALAARWADLAAWATARGLRVATVGSDGDCLYFPRLAGCSVPYASLLGSSDDRETQYVPGVSVRLPIPVDPAWPVLGPAGRVASSHAAPLTIARFAGRIADEVEQAARH